MSNLTGFAASVGGSMSPGALHMADEPDYVGDQRRTIAGAEVDARGWVERWAAPAVVIDAPNGFGEEVWNVAQPHTIIAWSIDGSEVFCELPRFNNRSFAPGQAKFNLQVSGSPQRYRAPGQVRFCQFYVQQPLLTRVADDLSLGNFSLDSLRDDLIMVVDHELSRNLNAYARRSHDRRRPASRIELEARAILVIEHLVRRYHTAGGRAPMGGGLAPWQIKRACEAMLAQLDGDPGLDDLAAIVGCSPTHFSRAFKQSTGHSPFRWLAERRVDRAKALLNEGRLPIAEIALAVGFSAQSQFTTAFGSATGVTPGRWRRERRS